MIVGVVVGGVEFRMNFGKNHPSMPLQHTTILLARSQLVESALPRRYIIA